MNLKNKEDQLDQKIIENLVNLYKAGKLDETKKK